MKSLILQTTLVYLWRLIKEMCKQIPPLMLYSKVSFNVLHKDYHLYKWSLRRLSWKTKKGFLGSAREQFLFHGTSFIYQHKMARLKFTKILGIQNNSLKNKYIFMQFAYYPFQKRIINCDNHTNYRRFYFFSFLSIS